MRARQMSKLVSGACFAAAVALVAPLAEAQTYPMRMGNITANDVQEALGRQFVEKVTERSNGRIEGRLFTAGALGSNDEVLRGLQAGSIQANINPTGFLSQFVPQAGVFSAPWIYPGETAAEITENQARGMQGEFGKRVRELSEERGFRVVSLFSIGPILLFTRAPVKTLDDLRGKRIRSVGGQEHTDTINDWGSRAIHMSLPEVFTAVQQGVLDGFELPADVTLRMGYHEHARHVLNTNHIAAGTYIAVSKLWYDRLPEDLQKVVDEVGQELETIGTQEYAKAQMVGLERLRDDERVTVTELSGELRSELERRNREGILRTLENDDVKGPALRMLLDDIEKLVK